MLYTVTRDGTEYAQIMFTSFVSVKLKCTVVRGGRELRGREVFRNALRGQG